MRMWQPCLTLAKVGENATRQLYTIKDDLERSDSLITQYNKETHATIIK